MWMGEILDSRPHLAWPGAALAFLGGMGGFFSFITVEAVSGILVGVGGVMVFVWGLWSGAKEKAAQNAYRREQEAIMRYDELVRQMVPIKDRNAELEFQVKRLRARVEYCEAHHETAQHRPG